MGSVTRGWGTASCSSSAWPSPWPLSLQNPKVSSKKKSQTRSFIVFINPLDLTSNLHSAVVCSSPQRPRNCRWPRSSSSMLPGLQKNALLMTSQDMLGSATLCGTIMEDTIVGITMGTTMGTTMEEVYPTVEGVDTTVEEVYPTVQGVSVTTDLYSKTSMEPHMVLVREGMRQVGDGATLLGMAVKMPGSHRGSLTTLGHT